MTRPTQTPPADELVELTDRTAPDFLERGLAVLAFLDGREPAQADKMRARLQLAAASLARPSLRVGVVDVARDRLVADALGVRSIPMTFVFVDGEVTDRLMGTPPAEIIEETLRARVR